ncbi:MAG: transketolase C-terminal domain-containing protein, partial [Pseudomonadota bacterium]|nr:transketolase C-terminal domain-containing protein [Pseudomonadota bacterium]
RFKASKWNVLSCDGHDMAAVDAVLVEAKTVTDKPVLIRCKTTIGKGSEKVGGTAKAHGAPLGPEEIEAVRAAIGWTEPAFVIPDDILAEWRNVGSHGHAEHKAWQTRLSAADQKTQFEADISGDVKQAAASAVADMKIQLRKDPQKVATRVASQKTIETLLAHIPSLFGGSADLTGSNNTKVVGHEIFSSAHPSGSYVHYGVREHGMAAAMNGIALHGGLIPFGGTFLVFTDYCRPSIRLSALMGQRVIYVMTHDSIGLGEDGPTHQPVEHLAALRAIPNLQVFRPADIVETAEAWQLALEAIDTPSVLALSRQSLPQLRFNGDEKSGEHQGDDSRENKSARGGYILKEGSAAPQVTLLATGSEVSLADEARTMLEADGITTRLVSVPCLDLLLAQDEVYKTELLGPSVAVVVVEAGLEMGWAALTYGRASFVGMTGFGASAPGGECMKNFGFTVENVVNKTKEIL